MKRTELCRGGQAWADPSYSPALLGSMSSEEQSSPSSLFLPKIVLLHFCAPCSPGMVPQQRCVTLFGVSPVSRPWLAPDRAPLLPLLHLAQPRSTHSLARAPSTPYNPKKFSLSSAFLCPNSQKHCPT